MKPKLIIIGTGGHAKVVAEAAQAQGKYNLIGFVDDFKNEGVGFMGLTVLGGLKYLQSIEKDEPTLAFVAIGDNYSRRKISESLPEWLLAATVIHPTAVISSSCIIGNGVFIAANTFVGAESSVKDGVIINTGASVDHDCLLFEFSSVAPKAVLGGTVCVSENSAIGIGATVSNKIDIGYSTVIGAGSVVVKDVPNYSVAYGNPCKVVRSRSSSDPYLK